MISNFFYIPSLSKTKEIKMLEYFAPMANSTKIAKMCNKLEVIRDK